MAACRKHQLSYLFILGRNQCAKEDEFRPFILSPDSVSEEEPVYSISYIGQMAKPYKGGEERKKENQLTVGKVLEV